MYCKYSQIELEVSYRYYETDCLFYIAKRLGVKMPKRYCDILDSTKQPIQTDSRTGDEIAEDVIRRMGLIRKEVNADGHDEPVD